MVYISTIRKAGLLYIKTKMSDFETHVVIGWIANALRVPANQRACLKVRHFCFNVKVACLSYGEYSTHNNKWVFKWCPLH